MEQNMMPNEMAANIGMPGAIRDTIYSVGVDQTLNLKERIANVH